MYKRFISIFVSMVLIISLSVESFAAKVVVNNNIESSDNTLLSGLLDELEISDFIEEFTSTRNIEVLKYINGYDNFNWLCSEQFNQYTQGKGDTNCLPTAIANIFSYYDLNGVSMFGGNFTQSMYDNLCNLLEFDPNYGADFTKADNAIKAFANQYGRNANVDTYWLNSWSDITRDIDRNIPILLSTDSFTKGGSARHSSVIVGYFIENGQKKVMCISGYGTTRPWITNYVYNSSFKMKAVTIY